jgi:hypothetical protein
MSADDVVARSKGDITAVVAGLDCTWALGMADELAMPRAPLSVLASASWVSLPKVARRLACRSKHLDRPPGPPPGGPDSMTELRILSAAEAEYLSATL